MTKPKPRSPKQNVSRFWTSAGFTIPIVLLILNAVLLWLQSQFGNLPEGVTIFYWQRFENYLSWLQVFTCVLAPVTLVLWAKTAIGQGPLYSSIAVIFIGFLLFGSACVNYTALFAFNYVDHIGTVQLGGNTYHLARVFKYDTRTIYYLGRCDQAGYQCAFHGIYYTYFQVDAPEIEISDETQDLLVRINNDVVYRFDGVQEFCIDETSGNCSGDLR